MNHKKKKQNNKGKAFNKTKNKNAPKLWNKNKALL